jgi:hypothetical protein
MLMGGIFLFIVFSFRFGTERGQDTRILGHFWNAVCANLSTEKYETGRYVCSNAALNVLPRCGQGM